MERSLDASQSRCEHNICVLGLIVCRPLAFHSRTAGARLSPRVRYNQLLARIFGHLPPDALPVKRLGADERAVINVL
jgi:hypothetical protein